MNLAIIIYCLLSGPLLIWDYFQRRKLKRQLDDATMFMLLYRGLAKESTNRYTELLKGTDPDAQEQTPT